MRRGRGEKEKGGKVGDNVSQHLHIISRSWLRRGGERKAAERERENSLFFIFYNTPFAPRFEEKRRTTRWGEETKQEDHAKRRKNIARVGRGKRKRGREGGGGGKEKNPEFRINTHHSVVT